MKTFLAAMLVLLIGAFSIWWWQSTTAPASDTAVAPTYTNGTYGYTLSYPADVSVHEYLPEAVSIGYPKEGGFDPRVDVSVERGESYAGATSSDAYAIERAYTKCAADGPGASFDCGSVLRSRPFTSAAGARGTELYLNLVHTTFGTSTASTTQEFGPVYVFEIGASAPGVPFAMLLIYRPLPAFLDAPDTALVSGIADSLSL